MKGYRINPPYWPHSKGKFYLDHSLRRKFQESLEKEIPKNSRGFAFAHASILLQIIGIRPIQDVRLTMI